MSLTAFGTTNFTSAGTSVTNGCTKPIAITGASVDDWLVVWGTAEANGTVPSANNIAITTGPLAAAGGWTLMKVNISTSGTGTPFVMGFAKVTTGGSGTITITLNTQNNANFMGGRAYLVPAADVAGSTPTFLTTNSFFTNTTGAVSCTLSGAASLVIEAMGDWNAASIASTAGIPATPSYDVRNVSAGAYSWWSAYWTSGTGVTAGTRNYGMSSPPSVNVSGAVVAFINSTPVGAPALSGAGTLSAAATPKFNQGVALSGVGTLVGAGNAPGAAVFSGAGTLGVTVKPGVAASPALSGAGVLTAAAEVPSGTHSVWDGATPSGVWNNYTDGGTISWEGQQFFSLDDDGNITAVMIYAYGAMGTSSLTGKVAVVVVPGHIVTGSDYPAGFVGVIQPWLDYTTFTTPLVSGWNTIPLASPVPFSAGDGLLAFYSLGGNYLYASTFDINRVQALDGSDLWLAQRGTLGSDDQRGFYNTDGADADWTTSSSPWYGIDIVVDFGGGTPTVGVTLSGSGTLTAVGKPALAAAVALAGAGTLVANGKPGQTSGAALSGEGTLSIVGKAGVASGAQLSGVGTLTAAGSAVGAVNVGLSGSGTLSIGGTPSIPVGVALSGAGTLSVGAKPQQAAVAALSGSGTLTVGAKPSQTATAALSGDGQLTVGVKPGASAVVPLSGSGTLTASGGNSPSGTVFLSGDGDLDAGGKATVSGTVHLSGDGQLTLAGKPGQSAAVQLSGTGQLTVGGNPAVRVTVALSGDGILTAGGNPATAQNVALSGAGQLVIIGTSGEVVCFPWPLDLSLEHDHYGLRIATDQFELLLEESAVTLSIETYCVED
jgi:hypothetical protein